MKADIPELRELRWERWWRRGLPETLRPQRVRAGYQGVVEHVNGGLVLPPQGGAPQGIHVRTSHFGDEAVVGQAAHPTQATAYSTTTLESSTSFRCSAAASIAVRTPGSAPREPTTP